MEGDGASAGVSGTGGDASEAELRHAGGVAIVKINAIEVPDGAGAELEARFAARMGAVEGTPGFLGFELLRPVAGEDRYFVYTRWETEEAFAAWSDGGARQAHGGGQRPVATGASLLEFEVVTQVGPTAAGG